MRKMIVCISAVIGLALGSGSALAASSIQRVIVVQTTDLKAYIKEVDTLRAEFKKAGVPVTLRAWRARFAGAEAGAVVVSVEMADLATLAKVDDAQKNNAEISATMQRIGALRKIVSDSLYEEL
jgi:ribosomal protein L11